MAKDYFQDIIPPASGGGGKRRISIQRDMPDDDPDDISPTDTAQDEHEGGEAAQSQEELRQEVGLRGIRNIDLPTRPRPRMMPDVRQLPSGTDRYLPRPRASARPWLWIVAIICLVVLALFAILALRPTTVTIVPRSHAIVFDKSAEFVAYPASIAASGTLPYTVQTIDLDDSEVIASQGGTAHVETKASGTITVYNAYSTQPVRLVATTRFETPDRLIFRTPNDIVIPGKKGSVPGKVDVTVIADLAGEQYNIPAATRLSLPGLRSNAAMYKGVYADSAGKMTGGFTGDKAATDPGARATAIANIRTRLLEAALKKAREDDGAAVVLPGLMQTTYQDLPDTTETAGIGIHERVHVLMPVFPGDIFAQIVGSSVTADAENTSLRLEPGLGYAALPLDTASSTLGTLPLHFALAGNATLVWNVDTQTLASALVGRDQAAFKGIIANFPGIETARARIEPFWKKTFPKDPKDIKIEILPPEPSKSGN